MREDHAPTLLKKFRLAVPNANEKHRQFLTESGIPQYLVTRLYSMHEKCRRQLARIELKIYYSLISSIKRKMHDVPFKNRNGLYLADFAEGKYFDVRSELMNWQQNIHYVDTLEQLLQVRSPKAARLRQDVERWKAKRPLSRYGR